MRPVADHPLKDAAQVEITCPRCGYRMMRTAARLRRETEVRCPLCGEAVAPATDEPQEKGTDRPK
jgi:DNA-directed RNA polymerase subunit RPC12/RpoP